MMTSTLLMTATANPAMSGVLLPLYYVSRANRSSCNPLWRFPTYLGAFTLLLAMVAVIIVLFNASCTVVSLFFAYFCFLGSLWHLRLIRLHQVHLNSSLSRFQSSELPSFRIFCPKCGSLVAMDYGEWATEILKLIWFRGEAHHLAGPWILWQTSWRLKTNSFR